MVKKSDFFNELVQKAQGNFFANKKQKDDTSHILDSIIDNQDEDCMYWTNAHWTKS